MKFKNTKLFKGMGKGWHSLFANPVHSEIRHINAGLKKHAGGTYARSFNTPVGKVSLKKITRSTAGIFGTTPDRIATILSGEEGKRKQEKAFEVIARASNFSQLQELKDWVKKVKPGSTLGTKKLMSKKDMSVKHFHKQYNELTPEEKFYIDYEWKESNLVGKEKIHIPKIVVLPAKDFDNLPQVISWKKQNPGYDLYGLQGIDNELAIIKDRGEQLNAKTIRHEIVERQIFDDLKMSSMAHTLNPIGLKGKSLNEFVNYYTDVATSTPPTITAKYKYKPKKKQGKSLIKQTGEVIGNIPVPANWKYKVMTVKVPVVYPTKIKKIKNLGKPSSIKKIKNLGKPSTSKIKKIKNLGKPSTSEVFQRNGVDQL